MIDPAIAAEPVKWLGESIGFWVQTIMLGISAAAGIWIIVSRGKQEGRRATVDLIIEQTRDEKLIEARQTIKAMHEHGETNLAKHLEDPGCEEYKAILKALNTYEFVASGIREGAFSEKVYKRLRCSIVMRDWVAFRGFVEEFRNQKGKRTYYQDFEWLYNRWEKNPLKQDK